LFYYKVATITLRNLCWKKCPILFCTFKKKNFKLNSYEKFEYYVQKPALFFVAFLLFLPFDFWNNIALHIATAELSVLEKVKIVVLMKIVTHQTIAKHIQVRNSVIRVRVCIYHVTMCYSRNVLLNTYILTTKNRLNQQQQNSEESPVRHLSS
jgi:hypothetical protein